MRIEGVNAAPDSPRGLISELEFATSRLEDDLNRSLRIRGWAGSCGRVWPLTLSPSAVSAPVYYVL